MTERTNPGETPPQDAPIAVLTVDVLGPPLVRWDEREASFRTRGELALLVYLALTGRPSPGSVSPRSSGPTAMPRRPAPSCARP